MSKVQDGNPAPPLQAAAEGRGDHEDGDTRDGVKVGSLTPEQRLHRSLYTTESWVEVAELLHTELGLTKAEIARGAGVDPITVARWLERPVDADIRAKNGLDDLRYVVLTLLKDGDMGKRLMKFWLTSRDVELGTDALSAIAQGRFDEVVAAGRALADVRRPARGAWAPEPQASEASAPSPARVD